MTSLFRHSSLHDALEDRQLLRFLGYQFFTHLEFFNGLYVIFLINQGLDSRLINLLVCTTTVVRVLGEVPSGYLGDRFGDQKMLALGTILMCVFALGLPATSTPFVLVILFIFHGLAIASTSGADDGLFYRTISQGDESTVFKLRPFATAINYISLGLSAVLGGILAQYLGWNSVFYSFVLSAIIGLFFLSKITKISVVSSQQAAEATTLAHILSMIRRNKRLSVIIALFAVIEACANVLFVFAQFRLDSLKLSLIAIGFAMGAVEAVSAIGSILSGLVTVGSKQINPILITLICAFITALVPQGLVFTLSFLTVILAATLLKVSAETFLVTHVPRELTATSLSLFSLLISAFTGLFHLMVACIGDSFTQNYVIVVLLLAASSASIGLWSMAAKSSVLEPQNS